MELGKSDRYKITWGPDYFELCNALRLVTSISESADRYPNFNFDDMENMGHGRGGKFVGGRFNVEIRELKALAENELIIVGRAVEPAYAYGKFIKMRYNFSDKSGQITEISEEP